VPTASSLLTLSPPTEHRDALYDEYNLTFFDEVVRVKAFMNRWRADREGQPVTPDDACAALVREVRQWHARKDIPFHGDAALAASAEDAHDAALAATDEDAHGAALAAADEDAHDAALAVADEDAHDGL
jgi:hypothetical protein